MSTLSTHVLDTAAGRPAAGVPFELLLDGAVLVAGFTDDDGRARLGEIGVGEYELVFSVGAYFGERQFLDRIPIRFRVSEPGAHYHVPLLVSPWSYSTYRGS